MSTIAEQICHVGKLMFDRHLTDIAGGNISAVEGDLVYISPRYAGNKYHWDLKPDQIISGRYETDELFSHPSFSREGLSHVGIYRNFPEAKAVIHAHPQNILPFTTENIPIPSVLKGTQKYGIVKYHDEAPSYSQEQAEAIVRVLQDQRDRIKEIAAAVLMPRHGIIIAAKDLSAAVDCLERLNTNAWCIIAQKILLLK